MSISKTVVLVVAILFCVAAVGCGGLIFAISMASGKARQIIAQEKQKEAERVEKLTPGQLAKEKLSKELEIDREVGMKLFKQEILSRLKSPTTANIDVDGHAFAGKSGKAVSGLMSLVKQINEEWKAMQ